MDNADRLAYRAARLEEQQSIRDAADAHDHAARVLGYKVPGPELELAWRLGGYSRAAYHASIALLPY